MVRFFIVEFDYFICYNSDILLNDKKGGKKVDCRKSLREEETCEKKLIVLIKQVESFTIFHDAAVLEKLEIQFLIRITTKKVILTRKQ